MIRWIATGTAAIAVIAIAAIVIGQARENRKAEQVLALLEESAARSAADTVDFASLSGLPPPVERYFRRVLTDGQKMIRMVRLRQSGTLRTGTASDRWLPFTAVHVAVPSARGFVWDARVAMPAALHVRILDRYMAGIGSGRVSLLSAFPVSSEAGAPELNAGALHRYLAEAVWFPTALLPQAGVVWSAIDDRAALATLTDSATTVALEFRFGVAGEVTGIHSSGRFGRFDGEYRKVAWEGAFRDYEARAGMRVPRYGEVGWYDGGALRMVWKGHVAEAQYEMEP